MLLVPYTHANLETRSFRFTVALHIYGYEVYTIYYIRIILYERDAQNNDHTLYII